MINSKYKLVTVIKLIYSVILIILYTSNVIYLVNIKFMFNLININSISINYIGNIQLILLILNTFKLKI